MALSTTLDVLAALLEGWATQPELAARIWDTPGPAQWKRVSDQIASLRRAGVAIEERPVERDRLEADVGRRPVAYRITMTGLRRRLKSESDR